MSSHSSASEAALLAARLIFSALQCTTTRSLRRPRNAHTLSARWWRLRTIRRPTRACGVRREYCCTVRGSPTRGSLTLFSTRSVLAAVTNSAGSSAGQKALPYDAALSSACCLVTSNSACAAVRQAWTASASWFVPSMLRMFSSALGSPSSKASMASYSSAAGAVEPMRRMDSVAAGTRWRTSQVRSVSTRQQSGSATRCSGPS
mmetsp:Transcript_13364/g.45175  ORF Transcript_13364/g.45175 Transcript_13364/m.45175 type:complete len:204 (+) Transcript_13364:1140-1751(+)